MRGLNLAAYSFAALLRAGGVARAQLKYLIGRRHRQFDFADLKRAWLTRFHHCFTPVLIIGTFDNFKVKFLIFCSPPTSPIMV